MDSPTFSIILPTYNRRSLLPRAIVSVLAQQYTNWELIVVDDGSTDNTKQYIQGLDNRKLQYYYQENKGRSAARNKGIEQASGEYICFLDSDDELMVDYLSHFAEVVGTHKNKIALAGVRLVSYQSIVKIFPSDDTSTCMIQCLEGCFNLMPFCFHKSLLTNHRFDEGLYYGEDFNFLIPILASYSPTVILDDTSIVHQHTNRTINTVFNNIPDGYKQLQKSVLLTIEENSTALSNFISTEKLSDIKKSKVRDYILTAAKSNFQEAHKINQKQIVVSITLFRLMIQRIKGMIQS